ncbi:restriction endonuclease subunit S [Acinetobacter sp. BMW17]|uniref:restriction endonuclease subunit S n=1 Tax=Acinetobacter sp. BMW17 TaxID=1795629 RepID=UPI000783EBE4|nr:restriction endonuclease subunit S [Acinetobacter sp. BMW17]
MSQFKDTDIGSIPNEWEISNIGSVADVTKLAGYEYTEYFKYSDNDEIIALRALNVREGILDLDNVKYISRDVSEALPRSKLFKHDLLFTYIGANIGQFAIVPENDRFHLAPNICRFRCNQDYYYYFLYSYMRSSAFRDSLEGYSHGSSQPTLPMGIIRTIPVPVPPLPEQKAIASVLSSLDDKIDLLHRQNKTLEAMAETLFRQWFIEEAKEDWEEFELNEFGQIICGKTPSKSNANYFGDDVPFLKIPDMHGKVFITKTIDSLSQLGALSQSKKMVPQNSICVSCIATVGLVCITDCDLQTNQQINSIVPTEPKFLYYLYEVMLGMYDELHNLASGGTATLNLNTGDFSRIKIAKPDDETLLQFNNAIIPLFTKIRCNVRQIQTLENLRDTLLPKLMSGEVRVQYQTEEVA